MVRNRAALALARVRICLLFVLLLTRAKKRKVDTTSAKGEMVGPSVKIWSEKKIQGR